MPGQDLSIFNEIYMVEHQRKERKKSITKRLRAVGKNIKKAARNVQHRFSSLINNKL